jgi:transposase InsO family protein
VFLVLSNDRRQILHLNVTEHPTAQWTGRGFLQACGLDSDPRYLIRDRDAIYGKSFRRWAQVLGIGEVMTAPGSPWQNAYAERVIGSIRRECLDHVVVLGERHLKCLLSEYMDYYNGGRTHLSLFKDAPDSREIQSKEGGKIVSLKRVGGLHHEYCRLAA